MSKYICFIIAAVLLCSCGKSSRFKISGSIKGIDEGELYVYNAEGLGTGLDTIIVRNGDFEYVTDFKQPTYFIVVFPNKYQQVVFVDKGGSVSLSGDGSELKNMEVDGGETNKKFSEFRKQVANVDESQLPAKAEEFIRNNPASMASVYLLNKYLVEAPDQQWKKIAELASLIKNSQPSNALVDRTLTVARNIQNVSNGAKCPAFTIKTKNGRTITEKDLSGKYTLITFWASWDATSRTQERDLRKIYKKFPSSKLQMIGVSLDVDRKMWNNAVRFDSLTWNEGCDFTHYENRMVKDFCVSDLPANYLIDNNGKIIGVNMSVPEIENRLNALIK